MQDNDVVIVGGARTAVGTFGGAFKDVPARELADSSTAFTVNRLCGSGLQAIVSAGETIHAGHAEIVVAGGVEQMSGFPFYDRQTRFGNRLGSFQMEDGLLVALNCPISDCHMGVTAENVAEQYGVSRPDQD